MRNHYQRISADCSVAISGLQIGGGDGDCGDTMRQRYNRISHERTVVHERHLRQNDSFPNIGGDNAPAGVFVREPTRDNRSHIVREDCLRSVAHFIVLSVNYGKSNVNARPSRKVMHASCCCSCPRSSAHLERASTALVL